MKKSDELKVKLEQINARIEELTADSAKEKANFEGVQAGFVAGKASLDDSLAAQQKAALLADALESLEQERETVTAQLSEATASETRDSLIAEAKTIAGEAHAELSEYEKQRAVFDAEIKTKAEALAEMFASFCDKRQAIDRLVRQVKPEADPAELEKKGLPEDVHTRIKQAVWHSQEPGYVNLVLQPCFVRIDNEHRRRVMEESARERAEHQANLRASQGAGV